ncbi:MAG: phosphorylated adapter RNA export RNA-binding domain-containing protein [Chloroflexales bacterium]|jgi:PHAX RNA-binding domain
MRASRARDRQAEEEAKRRAAADDRQQRRAFRQAVDEIATAMGETETKAKATIERSVAALGIESAQALRHEVEAIEAAGGMMTVDGSRRRTPGGVYLLLLKQRMNEAGRKDELKKILTG